MKLLVLDSTQKSLLANLLNDELNKNTLTRIDRYNMNKVYKQLNGHNHESVQWLQSKNIEWANL